MFTSLTWLFVLPFSLFSIYKYYRVRVKEDLKGVKLYQPLTTILSLIACVLSFFSDYSVPLYTLWIIIGMTLALIADFLNIDMTDMKVVIRGLIIFFLAYLVYTIATFIFTGFTLLMLIPIIVMGVVFLVVFLLVKNGLPSIVEKGAMGVYGLLIAMMVASAISTFFSQNFSLLASILLTVGFTFLLLGDYEFALSSYWKDLHFPYGPILYSGGQLLVAIALFYVMI